MKKKSLIDLLCFVLMIFAVTLTLPTYADDDKTTSDMEILRQKITADKKLLVANNMNLTEAEAKAFWPIYDAYQEELQQINERLTKVINDYATAFNKGAVLDDTAVQLIDEAIAVEMAEANLKRKYVPKLREALPGAKVARYIQIENKIRAIIRYELADLIPLAE